MHLDIGVFPLELDVYLDGYPGPWREIEPFRHRSGWLTVSEARMVMPFGTWRKRLCACISDHDEVYSPWLAGQLLTLPVANLRDAEHVPPEGLEDITDGLYWDFLGSADLKNLRHLEEEAERQADQLADFERRCRALIEKIDSRTRDLRAELRRGVTEARRVEIAGRMARYSDMTDQLTQALRQKAATIRAETDTLEEVVFSALSDFGEVEHLFTVRWRARTLSRGLRGDARLSDPRIAGLTLHSWHAGLSGRTLERIAMMRVFRHETDG